MRHSGRETETAFGPQCEGAVEGATRLQRRALGGERAREAHLAVAQRGLDQGEVDSILLRVAAAQLAHDADLAQALDRGAVISLSERGERLGDRQRDVA